MPTSKRLGTWLISALPQIGKNMDCDILARFTSGKETMGASKIRCGKLPEKPEETHDQKSLCLKIHWT